MSKSTAPGAWIGYSVAVEQEWADGARMWHVFDDVSTVRESDEIDALIARLSQAGELSDLDSWEPNPEPIDSAVDHDAYVLASAGHGTDEDYGYYGGGEDW